MSSIWTQMQLAQWQNFPVFSLTFEHLYDVRFLKGTLEHIFCRKTPEPLHDLVVSTERCVTGGYLRNYAVQLVYG